MQNNQTLKLVNSALLGTLVFIGTQFIKIPLPFGYFNMGDCFVLLSGWLIGGSYAMLGSAIGAVLADVISGYVIYAPATFIIKSIMSLIACTIYQIFFKKTNHILMIGYFISAFVAELIMIFGYFFYDSLLYGAPASLLSIQGNLIQGFVAIISSILFMKTLEHTGLSSWIKNK